MDRGFTERMSPFYSSEWLSRLKPHIKHDIYRQGSVESAPFMWGGERLQGWAFKAMSLNCILAKWDEWCFLIRLLTGFCVVKTQRWCLIVEMLNDMLLAQLSQTLAIFKCILALIWHTSCFCYCSKQQFGEKLCKTLYSNAVLALSLGLSYSLLTYTLLICNFMFRDKKTILTTLVKFH